MLARLFLALMLAALALPQVAMACHRPVPPVAMATDMSADCHGMTHAPEPDQPDRVPELCIGCIAPVTVKPVVVPAPLPIRPAIRPIGPVAGQPLLPPTPATPPPRPLA